MNPHYKPSNCTLNQKMSNYFHSALIALKFKLFICSNDERKYTQNLKANTVGIWNLDFNDDGYDLNTKLIDKFTAMIWKSNKESNFQMKKKFKIASSVTWKPTFCLVFRTQNIQQHSQNRVLGKCSRLVIPSLVKVTEHLTIKWVEDPHTMSKSRLIQIFLCPICLQFSDT